MIIVKMHAADQFAQRGEGFLDALSGGAVGEMGMADIEVEAQTGKASLVIKGTQIGGITHFAGGVFDADGHANVAGVKNEVLERTEGGIALAQVRSLTRSAHMEDHTGKGQNFGDVN